MKCINCNAEIPDDADFCTNCGTRPEFNRALIDRAKNGDSQAETTLYNATHNNVYALIKSMIQDEDTVLDLMQDSYLKAFRNLGQLQEANKFRPWLKTIARNRTMDYFRERKQVLFSEMTPLDDEDASIEFEDTNPDAMPDVVIDRQETSRLMAEILDTLSKDQRAVLSMMYYEQMSLGEISSALGVNENTILSRLSRGRKEVEKKVRELEKKGTKLYGLAPIPFLLMLLRKNEAYAMGAESAAASLSQILQQMGQPANIAAQEAGVTAAQSASQAAGQAAGTAVHGASAMAAATAVKAGIPLAAKIAAAAVGIAVVGGVGISIATSSPAEENAALVAESGEEAGAAGGVEGETVGLVAPDEITPEEEEQQALIAQSLEPENPADEIDFATLTPVVLSEKGDQDLRKIANLFMFFPEGNYSTPAKIRNQIRQSPDLVGNFVFETSGAEWEDITGYKDGYIGVIEDIDTSYMDSFFHEMLDLDYDYRLLSPVADTYWGAYYENGTVGLYIIPTGGFSTYELMGSSKSVDGHTVGEYTIKQHPGTDVLGRNGTPADIKTYGSIRIHITEADNSFGFKIAGVEVTRTE